jgi:hypothetical protein
MTMAMMIVMAMMMTMNAMTTIVMFKQERAKDGVS